MESSRGHGESEQSIVLETTLRFVQDDNVICWCEGAVGNRG